MLVCICHGGGGRTLVWLAAQRVALLESRVWGTAVCYADKELNPSKLATELLPGISGSWKAELANAVCSDPSETVAFRSGREMGTREVHVSSCADGCL